jgi:hypothetical protein
MGPCKVCGQLSAFGYRKPGPLSKQARKGYVWSCADHRSAIEARWAIASGTARSDTSADAVVPAGNPDPDGGENAGSAPKQGSLDL